MIFFENLNQFLARMAQLIKDQFAFGKFAEDPG